MRYKTYAELKDMAKEKLNGRYGSSILTCVLPEIFTSSFMLPVMMISNFIFLIFSATNPGDGISLNGTAVFIINFLLSLITAFFGGVFRTGQSLYFLNLACGKRASVTDIFFGFRWQFKKSFLLSVVTCLIYNISELPVQIYREFFAAPNTSPADLIMHGAMLLLLTVLCGAVAIILQVSLSQIFYLLLDFPKHSAGEIIKTSIRIMKGHKLRRVGLYLSFLPLMLLCLLTLGIGFLWLLPYMRMTYALFFLDLMNPEQTQVVTS